MRVPVRVRGVLALLFTVIPASGLVACSGDTNSEATSAAEVQATMVYYAMPG